MVRDSVDKITIPLGFIPKGNYIYPVIVTNPLEFEVRLILTVLSGDNFIQEMTFDFSNRNHCCDFYFSINNNSESVDTKILIGLEKNSSVKIQLPVSPKKKSKRFCCENDWYELEELVNAEIADWENGVTHAVRIDAITKTAETIMNKRQIESHIQTRYFRGLLSLEEAERQMDFVVKSRIFSTDNYKGFKRWKRALLRRTVQFLYRVVTRNAARKLYFTKLYRNYVNNNLLAENLHGE